MGNVITSTPNEAAIISGFGGTRVIVGSCGCQLCCCQTVERLSLQMMKVEIDTFTGETQNGVRVTVKGICQMKVCSSDNPTNDEMDRDVPFKVNDDKIKLAAQHFLGRSTNDIMEMIKATMEGHQRHILGQMTVEEIYKDRRSFATKIADFIRPDLLKMGFELVSYTIKSIEDENEYMLSLGKTQIAVVKRDASVGQAKNENAAKMEVAKYETNAAKDVAERQKEAYVKKNEMYMEQAQSDRDLKLKQAEYKVEISKQEAVADCAGQIEQEKQKQTIIREKTTQDVEKAKVMLMVAEQDALKRQKEAEGLSLAYKVKIGNESEANLIKTSKEGEMKKVQAAAESKKIEKIGTAEALVVRRKAEADAEKTQKVGEATGKSIQAKGEAEALTLLKKAQAYELFGDAAIIQTVAPLLPQIAENIAKPLGKTEKMVFISQDGAGGSKLTTDMVNMMTAVPEAIESMTGVNITKAVDRLAKGRQGTTTTAQRTVVNP